MSKRWVGTNINTIQQHFGKAAGVQPSDISIEVGNDGVLVFMSSKAGKIYIAELDHYGNLVADYSNLWGTAERKQFEEQYAKAGAYLDELEGKK